MLIVPGGCTNVIIAAPEGKNVKRVTAAQKKNCTFIKTVYASQPIVPDKTGDALKMTLN